MKTILISIIVMLLLVSPIVLSALSDAERETLCDKAISATNWTSLTDDLLNSADGSDSGDTTLNANGGQANQAYATFDGTGDMITYPNNGNMSDMWNVSSIAWVRFANTGQPDAIMARYVEPDADSWIITNEDDSNEITYNGANGGIVRIATPNTNLETSTWWMVSATTNVTSVPLGDTFSFLYINGTIKASSVSTTPDFTQGDHAFTVGGHGAGSRFEGDIGYAILFNDTLTTTEITDVFDVTVLGEAYCPFTSPAVSDTTIPSFGLSSLNNTSPNQNDVVEFAQVINDDTALSEGRLFHNKSGSFVNESSIFLSGTSINATFNLTMDVVGVTGFGWWANDTSGNSNTSIVQTVEVIVDLIAPVFNRSSVNNSAPVINEVVAFSQEFEDNVALLQSRFFHNQSGVFINESLMSISGNNFNSTFNLTLTLGRGNIIGYGWWVDDTSGNTNISGIATVAMANTAPDPATILAPVTGKTNSIDFNVTSNADIDGDSLTYNYYINGTFNTSSAGNITFTGSDGTYQLNVDVNDGFDSSATNATITFTLDTTTPIITITSPLGASSHSTDIEIDISCTDNDIFKLNYTMSNASDVIKSIQNNTAIGSPIIIKDIINITGLADGDYNIDVICVDTHTGKEIGNYNPVKDLGNLKLTYTPDNNDNIGIKLKSTTATLDDFGTFKDIDRYIFWFDFVEPENIIVYEYVFKIDNKNGLIYLPDSNYKAHFVTGSLIGNWIDFEFDENDDATYTVTETADNKYEVKILTTKTYLNFRSIGGLNRAEESITITIDTGVPAPAPAPSLPLSNIVQIAGMVALLLIVVGVVFAGVKKKK